MALKMPGREVLVVLKAALQFTDVSQVGFICSMASYSQTQTGTGLGVLIPALPADGLLPLWCICKIETPLF